MLSLRRRTVFAAAFFTLASLIPSLAAQAKEPTYAQSLDLAIAALEEGKHIEALGPLRTALNIDRNEPCGILALGTLYLHANSPTRAAREFERVAQELAPNDPLAKWGAALAQLEQGKTSVPLFESFSDKDIPAAATMLSYARLMNGQVRVAHAATAEVGSTDTDDLRVEVAAFAAAHGGDNARAETLLNALLARPEMRTLAEDRAVYMPFQNGVLAQGGAPSLPTALGFPDATPGAIPLTGRASLVPPDNLPRETATVTYSAAGNQFAAATNNPPFTSEWNTTRFPNGFYTLRTVAYAADRRVLQETSRTVTISNPDAPASQSLTPEEQKDMRERLLFLLTPRPSRKAAHYFLAAQAATRGDGATSLAHMETVMAIDPDFGNAQDSVRAYYKKINPTHSAYWRGITNEKIVALTFDDGPNPLPDRTPALLDALKAANAPSTFFVVGARAEQCVPLLKRMVNEGHEIANHSYSHPNLTFLDRTGVARELSRTSVIVREATGIRPQFYRPPGGNFNSLVVDCANGLGMGGAYWTIDVLKFEAAPFTSQNLVNFVMKSLRPGAIILLHNAPENTIRAIPILVATLRSQGYEVVTMSELARRSEAGGPPNGKAAPTSYGEHKTE